MLAVLASCGFSGSAHNNSDNSNGGITLPEGFHAIVVAENTGNGRHIAINENGDIYVSLSRSKNGGGIAALRDTDGDGIADEVKYFGTFTGTGIGIYKGYLYFASDTAVIRYKLRPGELVPDEDYEIIAQGFTLQHQHETKEFTFDNDGHLYVTVGAPSNACQDPDRTPGTPGQNPCPLLERYGGIWRFDAEKLHQDQMANGYRYATGIRNAVALRWNTNVNSLYCVQHGRDQLSQLWPDIYSEDDGANLPGEEFFKLKDGSDCGWPYCYYDPFKKEKLLAPEYGGDAKTQGVCEGKEQPIMAFPAHFAPNDLIFYNGGTFPAKYTNGAFIAFHGSWNRAPLPQKGYLVAFVPFKNDMPSGDWEIFADDFAGVKVIKSPSDAKYRPCGLTIGPDGALYVVDSNKGKIWKIYYK